MYKTLVSRCGDASGSRRNVPTVCRVLCSNVLVAFLWPFYNRGNVSADELLCSDTCVSQHNSRMFSWVRVTCSAVLRLPEVFFPCFVCLEASPRFSSSTFGNSQASQTSRQRTGHLCGRWIRSEAFRHPKVKCCYCKMLVIFMCVYSARECFYVSAFTATLTNMAGLISALINGCHASWDVGVSFLLLDDLNFHHLQLRIIMMLQPWFCNCVRLMSCIYWAVVGRKRGLCWGVGGKRGLCWAVVGGKRGLC